MKFSALFFQVCVLFYKQSSVFGHAAPSPVRESVEEGHAARKEGAHQFLRSVQNNNGDNTGYDACYIHTGCEGGAGFCDQDCCDANNGCYGGGPAWFCDDGEDLNDGSTSLDDCAIHVGCTSGGVVFDVEGSQWVCNDELAHLAQSCDDLSATCVNGCGSDAVFPDCVSDGASCTPFSFMPNISNQDCSGSMDDASLGFSSTPFFVDGSPYSYQAYQADGYDDIWILHGCDGAGIQTDCVGDYFYLEHFDGTNPIDPEDCPLSNYGDASPSGHIQCPTFYHPGMQVNLPQYSCGWWRGYDQPVGIENASNDGVGAFGPHGGGGDYSNGMRSALANCPTCAGQTGLDHPYGDTDNKAIAYFTGAIFPWICWEDTSMNIPYTGALMNCACDNEPWNGRGDGEREYPKTTQISYCGLYLDDNTGANKLVCDFIDMGDGEATAVERGVELLPTSW
jgi:hypothetical protein